MYNNNIMENFESWKVDCKQNNREFILYINNNQELKDHHLLDSTKYEYTLFEKYIYDTAKFHLNRLNIDNIDDYYVEFWCNSKYDTNDENIYIDCDSKLKTSRNYYFPLLSCIAYFNDNTNIPTLISNIDLDTYKYKEFDKQNSIILSLPKTNKQITFDGRLYHGNVLINEHDYITELYTLYINLWNKKPSNIEYYMPKYDTKLSNKPNIGPTLEIDKCICNIKISEDIINYNFFNNLLYDKHPDVCYRFNELIKDYLNDSIFHFEVDKSIKIKTYKLKINSDDIANDIDEIINERDTIKYNRFLQRFTFNNLYSYDLSSYIINEYELYIKAHPKNPIYSAQVNNIPSIFGIIKTTIDNTIFDNITNSYNLKCYSNNIFLDVIDLYIVKYKYDEHKSLKMHHNIGFFTFSILLNNDFTGGGIHFDDGLTVNLNRGDMLIHNSNIKHSVLPITNGQCYILVGIIKLGLNIHDEKTI